MYVKIFDRILNSSIWDESSDTRVVWFTLLLMADFEGNVISTISGIARAANLPIEAVQAALDKFQRPDPASTTDDDNGKRIESVGPNRWVLPNYSHYRAMATAEDERAASAVRSKRYRDRQRELGDVDDVTTGNDASRPVTVASRPVTVTEADKETDKNREPARTHAQGEVLQDVPTEPQPPTKQTITFDSTTGRFLNLTQGDIERWKAAFPDVDICQDILQAEAHYSAHPKRAPRGADAESRLLSWFKRTMDRVRDTTQSKAVDTKAFRFTPDGTKSTDSASMFTPPVESTVDVPLMDCDVDWLAVLPVLKDRLRDGDAYAKYIEPLIYLGDLSSPNFNNPDRHDMLFEVPDEYTRNHIRYNLGPYIVDAVSDVMGKPFGLAFKVSKPEV